MGFKMWKGKRVEPLKKSFSDDSSSNCSLKKTFIVIRSLLERIGESSWGWFADCNCPEQTGNLIFLCASRGSVKEEGAESVVPVLSPGSSKWWGKSGTVRCWAGKSWWGFLAEQLWSARSDQLWASRGGLWGDVAVGQEKRNLLGKQRNLRPEAEKASQILEEGDGRQKLASEKKKKKEIGFHAVHVLVSGNSLWASHEPWEQLGFRPEFTTYSRRVAHSLPSGSGLWVRRPWEAAQRPSGPMI